MTTIAETLQALKEEFASLPDGFARYAYLTELSALLAPPPEVRRAEYSDRGLPVPGLAVRPGRCRRVPPGGGQRYPDHPRGAGAVSGAAGGAAGGGGTPERLQPAAGAGAFGTFLLHPHRRSGRSPAGNPPAVVSKPIPNPLFDVLTLWIRARRFPCGAPLRFVLIPPPTLW